MKSAAYYLDAALWDPGNLEDSKGGRFLDYYDKDWEYDERFSTKYYGKNVIWIGEEGRMLRVSADYVSPREDNIFDAAKLNAVRNHILKSSERVELDAAYADVLTIDRTVIEETQEGAQSERLWEWSIDHPFTTGDDELDEYLANPEGFLEYEEDPEKRREELEEDLRQKKESGGGDFGKLWVRIRDGNHRAFGALAAGEPYIYVIVMKNSSLPNVILE